MNQCKKSKIVKYQNNKKIMNLFKNNAVEIYKKSVTLGRLPSDNEIDKILITYISDNNGSFKEETRNKITENVVIARNPKPIISNIYNEWLVPKDIWKKNYGVDAVKEFKEYQKLGTIKAIEITSDILNELGSIDGLTAKIEVSWNANGMKVFKGGFLTDQGYAISPKELESTYSILNNKN